MMSRIQHMHCRAGGVIAARSGIGIALAAVALFSAATDAAVAPPGNNWHAALRFTYSALSYGGFVAFSSGDKAIVESRWTGPHLASLKAGDFLLPFPLAKPGISVCKYYFDGAISPNRQLFSTAVRTPGAGGWRVCIWNLKGVHLPPIILTGHCCCDGSGGLAFSPDGRRLVSVSPSPRNGSVVIHSVRSGRVYRRLAIPRGVQLSGIGADIKFFSPTGLACVISDTKVLLTCWNTQSGGLLYSRQVKALLDCGAVAADLKHGTLLLGGQSVGLPRKLLVATVNGATGKTRDVLSISRSHGARRGDVQWKDITHICVAGRGRFAIVTETGGRSGQRGYDRIAGRFLIIDLKRMQVRYRSPTLNGVPWYSDVSAGGRRILIGGNTKVYLMRLPFKL